MKPSIRIVIVITCLTYLGLSSCKKDRGASAGPASETLLNHLQNNYAFSLFDYALQKTGLDKQIGKDPLTLLVPDNDAFARDSVFSTNDLDKMDTAYLRRWMAYHILPGNILVGSIPQTVNTPYSTISGGTLYFSRPVPGNHQVQTDFDHILHINGDTVNSPDITASDGVIQVLNRPLKYPDTTIQGYLSAHSQYSELVICLQHFGLWDQLAGPGPFTVFAPENSSFVDVRVSPDSLNRLDTVLFKTSLFSIYIVKQARIFLTDFNDIASGTINNQGGYLTPDGVPYYWYNGALTGSGYDPVSNQPVPQAYWISADNITTNGVVHGMHGVLLTPGQAKK